MTKPTPSPAPASGAETCKHRHAYGCTCGYCITGGCTLLHAKPALPTPPSDAGTSEREMCPDCPHAPHLGTPCAECRRFGGFRGECSHQGAKGRPAAEGPREDRCALCGKIWGDHFDGDFCDRNHGHEEDGVRVFTPTTSPDATDDCGDSRAVQALAALRQMRRAFRDKWFPADGSHDPLGIPFGQKGFSPTNSDAVPVAVPQPPITGGTGTMRASGDREVWARALGCKPDDNFYVKPRAALPGAEAGTPEDSLCRFCAKPNSEHPFSMCWGVEGDDTPAAYSCTTEGCSAGDCPNCRAVAALTSEVRVLREDKARLDWMQEHAAEAFPVFDMDPEAEIGYRVKSEETLDAGEGAQLRDAIDAARLASPSPTGAP